MALSASTVWEVRTGGNNANGGGFVSGGVDRSQQDAAHASGTNLTVDGTTNTDVTPDGHTPHADDVGNLIQITAGAGFTQGFYEIKSIQSGKWRLDRSPAATTTSGGTWALGGAVATWTKAIQLPAVPGNKIWIKSGTYTVTSTANPASTLSGTATDGRITFEGYHATRGDRTTRPLITTATNSVGLFTTDGNTHAWLAFINLRFSNTASTRSTCITDGSFTSFANMVVDLCDFDGFTSAIGWNGGSTDGHANRCLFRDISGTAVECNYGATLAYCVFQDIGSHGIRKSWSGLLLVNSCIFDSCGGNGILHDDNTNGVSLGVIDSSFYNNTGSGVRQTGTVQGTNIGIRIENCIFDSNGTYGVNLELSGAKLATSVRVNQFNAYRNNTSGARNNLPVGQGDVTLMADPFTNAAAGDFSLNNTAGGGAACRAAGFPGVFPGGLTTGYLDIGAVQHQDAGGNTAFIFTRRGGSLMKM